MKKNERLSDIIGKCDDEFITKASVDATPIAKRRFSIAPFAAAAASICLVGGGIFAYSQSIKGENPQAPASSENELITEDSSQNAIEIAPEYDNYAESELRARLTELYMYKAQLEEELHFCHAELAETEDEAKLAELSEQITAKSEELSRIEAEIADYERQLQELMEQHNTLGMTEVEVWNSLSGFWNGADNSFCQFKPQDSENSAYFATSFWESEWGGRNGNIYALTFTNTDELTFSLPLDYSTPGQDSEGLLCDVIVDYSKLKQDGVIHVTYGSEDLGEFAYAGATQEEAFENYVNGTNAEPDIYEEPQWDDKTFYQQFPCFEFNDISYVAAGETYAEIGEKLGTAIANNVDIYTGTDFNVELEIFEIVSVDSDYAVAVKTLDGFYGVYTNCYYETATFGDMVEGLNLEENLRFGSCGIQTETDMTVSYTNILNTDDEAIWEFLADCYDAQSVGDYTEFDGEVFMDESDILDEYINFAVASTDILGFENLSFAVTKGGYITTNIIATGRAFYIGVDKANEFAEMIKETHSAEIALGDKEPMFDDVDDNAEDDDVLFSMSYAPIDDSQSATLIAEFKEQMGEAPLNLTTEQANLILQKISGLTLKYADVSEIEFPDGGGIVFEIVGGHRYNFIGENILLFDDAYYSIESDATELISELTSLLDGASSESNTESGAENASGVSTLVVAVYELNGAYADEMEIPDDAQIYELQLVDADESDAPANPNNHSVIEEWYEADASDKISYSFLGGSIVKIGDDYYRDLSGNADILKQAISDSIHNKQDYRHFEVVEFQKV